VTGAKNLVIKFARTDQRNFSVSVRLPDRRNRLPYEIKQAANQEDFRKRLRKRKFLSSRGTETRTKTVYEKHWLLVEITGVNQRNWHRPPKTEMLW
jgi:hypothetical protein